MSELGLRAYDEESQDLRVFSLPGEMPGETRLHLRGLPGASAVQLELVSGDEVRRRFEVEVDGEEAIVVHLERTEDGRLDAWSQGREVLSLPPDARYAPVSPAADGPSRGSALDLAVLVDGTTRVCREATRDSGSEDKSQASEPEACPLLADEDAWSRHVDLLVEIAGGLAEETDVKAGVFAFGDRPVEDLRARGLRPGYPLHPRNGSGWKLGSLTSDELRARLLAVPPTSGGDFMDALADGLEALTRLPWREGARRLVLLTGDSPGYSILHPAPAGANLLPRRLDVDTQVLALHRIGVEVVTLYHALPAEARQRALDYERVLLDHAALQYRRLASRRELAFEAGQADPADVVHRVLDGPWTCARGAGYGVLLETPGG